MDVKVLGSVLEKLIMAVMNGHMTVKHMSVLKNFNHGQWPYYGHITVMWSNDCIIVCSTKKLLWFRLQSKKRRYFQREDFSVLRSYDRNTENSVL